MSDIRDALDRFVAEAGARLNGMDRILVPNIAESHREPERWGRHAAYGGGFEEVWLAYGPDDYLDPETSLRQMGEVEGPGLTIMRVASDGTDHHQNFMYGLAAFWVFGGGKGGAITATAHDGYSATPFIPALDVDLGSPVEEAHRKGNGWSREFDNGWVAVNLNANRRRSVNFEPPDGLREVEGGPAPARLKLAPHRGALYVRT